MDVCLSQDSKFSNGDSNALPRTWRNSISVPRGIRVVLDAQREHQCSIQSLLALAATTHRKMGGLKSSPRDTWGSSISSIYTPYTERINGPFMRCDTFTSQNATITSTDLFLLFLGLVLTYTTRELSELSIISASDSLIPGPEWGVSLWDLHAMCRYMYLSYLVCISPVSLCRIRWISSKADKQDIHHIWDTSVFGGPIWRYSRFWPWIDTLLLVFFTTQDASVPSFLNVSPSFYYKNGDWFYLISARKIS